METMLLLDFAGVAVFAATGALTASRAQLDIIGFLFLAAVTGVGGGTLRDLMLGVPVFWVEHHAFVLVCAAVAVAVHFLAPLVESRYRLLLWLDAVGLAAYCVYGAHKGLMVTGSPVIAVVMGLVTATVGGILRDVLASEPSILMRSEIYVSAALVGALGYVGAVALGVAVLPAVLIGFVLALCARGGGLVFGWTLPRYRPRPGRDPEKML